MIDWWQQLPYSVTPFLFEFNGFGIRYYSLMYIMAFATVFFLIRYRLKTENFSITLAQVQQFVIWAAWGVLLGGRMGYVLFYDLPFYRLHPFRIFLPFNFENGFTFTGISGMSYHGGLIGVIISVLLFCRKQNLSALEFSDLLCPAVPLGYTFGRLGNFFNAELYGRVTQVPWGMYFPSDPAHALRHPSQLYEAFFEGIFLFAVLWKLKNIEQFKNRLFALYLTGYGSIRFLIEFVRMPDAHLSFVFYNFTMGQVLCSVMIVSGISLFYVKQSVR